MSAFASDRPKGHAAHTVLASIAVVILVAVLTGLNERLGIGDGGAFWALFVVGMVICAGGPLGKGAKYGWWNPLHIAGYLLGVVLLLLGGAVLFDVVLPGAGSAQGATVLLGTLMAVKGVLALFYRQPR